MQTMKRDSFTAMCIYGGVTGMVAWGLSALTDTGTAGLYAFSFIGMVAVPLCLIWPERTRFVRHRPPSTSSNSRTRRARHPGRHGAT